MKTENHERAVQKIREELAARGSDLSANAAALHAPEEADAELVALVDRLASLVSIQVGQCVDPNNPRTERLFQWAHPDRRPDPDLIANAIVARVAPDQFLAVARAEVDKLYRDLTPDAWRTDAERTQTEAKLRAEIANLERAEEAAIVTAEADGIVIPRRADVGVHAVLGDDLNTATALSRFRAIEEGARQRWVVMMDLGERRQEARKRLSQLEGIRQRAERSARQAQQELPPDFDADLTTASAELERLEAEYARAETTWQDYARCLPALKDALRHAGVALAA